MRGKRERQMEEVNYIQYLPWQFQQYMSHTKDVEGDGHCGFRAIAAHIYGTEECWVQVRHDLIQEINQNRALYNAVYPSQLDFLYCDPTSTASYYHYTQVLKHHHQNLYRVIQQPCGARLFSLA